MKEECVELAGQPIGLPDEEPSNTSTVSINIANVQKQRNTAREKQSSLAGLLLMTSVFWQNACAPLKLAVTKARIFVFKNRHFVDCIPPSGR